MNTTMTRKASTDSALCTEASVSWPNCHGLAERDEMEDHAQIGGVKGDAAQQVTGAGERHQCVQQAHSVAAERDSQPKQRHMERLRFSGAGRICSPPRTVIIVCTAAEAEDRK